ncbi:hypothetical protein PG997_002573 [Apiospora hydei]|uniref:Uncharacterized protein n=1 Tax=Apiospora hydei TaxID=1337664 RepID=A0ABR1WWT8_9PEZI
MENPVIHLLARAIHTLHLLNLHQAVFFFFFFVHLIHPFSNSIRDQQTREAAPLPLPLLHPADPGPRPPPLPRPTCPRHVCDVECRSGGAVTSACKGCCGPKKKKPEQEPRP